MSLLYRIFYHVGFTPLAPGASGRDLASALPEWKLVDEEAYDVSALPALLRKVKPYFYRLRRE